MKFGERRLPFSQQRRDKLTTNLQEMLFFLFLTCRKLEVGDNGEKPPHLLGDKDQIIT